MIFWDDALLIKNSNVSKLVLKKKTCPIYHHNIRESMVSGKILFYYDGANANVVDPFTKVLSLSNDLCLRIKTMSYLSMNHISEGG